MSDTAVTIAPPARAETPANEIRAAAHLIALHGNSSLISMGGWANLAHPVYQNEARRLLVLAKVHVKRIHGGQEKANILASLDAAATVLGLA